MKPTLESRDQWDADIVSIALRTGGTIPADLFVREMKRAIAAEREACAKVCEEFDCENPYIGQARAVAFEIRQRNCK